VAERVANCTGIVKVFENAFSVQCTACERITHKSVRRYITIYLNCNFNEDHRKSL